MDNTIFAETLAASDSANLANDSKTHQTILAPVNEAYSESFESQEVLNEIRYHFLDTPINLEKLKHNDLLTTKYTLKSLNGKAQKVKITKHGDKILLNNLIGIFPESGTPLLDPLNIVHSGNTVIYSLDSKLSPPGPLRPTTSEGLTLFRSFHHLVFSGLDQRIIFDETAITALLPDDSAWKGMGLAEKYLLSDEAGDNLKKVMLSCILKGVHYSGDFSETATDFETLSGETVSLRADKNGLVFEDKGIKVELTEKDILASNGVGHSISSVPLPNSVIITPENLINATGFKGWLNILQEHDLQSYLDINSNHTLLIPTDEAIHSASLNTLKPDIITSIINFHIIPPSKNGQPVPDLFTSNPSTIHTLSGTELNIKQIYPSVWTIKTNSSSTAARVLDQGKTSHGSQIVLIDAVLFEQVVRKSSWAKIIAVVIFGVAMTVMVAAVVGWFVRWVQRRRETKPLFEDEERDPLLDGDE